MESETGITYYKELPEGYVLMKDYKEIFKTNNGSDTLTLENSIIREGLELIIFNPYTNEFYPRYIHLTSDRKALYKYFTDGNLFIKQKDLIWMK